MLAKNFVTKDAIKNFRDLDIWKLGKEITLSVYEITKGFPEEERYGLISQMRRAAVSTPSNIAEGFNRYHNKEYRQLFYTALGSCGELETQIEIVFDLGYIDDVLRDGILERLDHESRMLRSMIKKL